MTLAKLLQVAGLAWVTYVMVRSYQISDMTFQFGGLGLGALVFMLGRWLEGDGAAEG